MDWKAPIWVGLLIALLAGPILRADVIREVRIGVLAKRGAEQTLSRWTPLAQYLSTRVERPVRILALDFAELPTAVARGAIDFVISNPAIYVALEKSYGVTRIATMKNRIGEYVLSSFGGVVFTRSDRDDLNELSDLEGQSVAAVDPTSLGGYLMALREFRQAGLDPAGDFRALGFLETHDAVVRGVLERRFDAGTVRTDTLENMASEGHLDLRDVKVLKPRRADSGGFPLLLSTETYAEWPFARLQGTTAELTERIAVALLQMPEDHPAAQAAKIAGWTVPLNYQPLHDLLRELRAPPYQDEGKITLGAVLNTYWPWLLALFAALLVSFWLASHLRRMNRALQASEADLRRSRDQLERRVDERTRELASLAARLKVEVARAEEARAAIHSAWEELDDLLDAIPDATLRVAADGTILRVNAKAEKLFGYSRAELLAMRVEQLMPKRFREGHAGQRSEYFKRTRSHAMRPLEGLQIVTKDGRELFVDIGLSQMTRNGVKTAIAAVRDISIQVNAQIALRRSEERLRISQRIARLGSWDWNLDEAGFVCSDELCRLLGEPRPPQSLGELLRHIHPDDRDAVYGAIDNARRQGTGFHTEHRLIGSNGREFTVLHLGEVTRGASGSATRIIGVIQDITARKRAEATLKDLTNRLRLATRAAHIGVWELDMEDSRLDWDDAMFAIHDVRAEEFTGQVESWKQNVVEADVAATEAALERAIWGGEELDTEFRIRRSDGTTHYIRTAGLVTRGESGEPLRMTGVNWDITDAKLAEGAIREAKEAAEAANRAKSLFLANMSHEIRTPMNAIIGLGQLVLATKLTDQQQDYMRKIQTASRSLLRLLDSVLDHSRIEAGRLEIEHLPFRIEEVIDQVSALFSRRAEEKGIVLRLNQSAAVPTALIGDPLRFGQVIDNLVGNAIKFTERGTVDVTLDAVDLGPDRIEMRVQVRDTGIGVDSGRLPSLFDPFHQADGSISRRYGGSGLGLTICKQLVELMGGRIEAESIPGVGSTFRFSCPMAKVGQSNPGDEEPVDLSHLRVMVLDPRRAARTRLHDLLAGWRISVIESRSLAEARQRILEAAERHRPVDVALIGGSVPEAEADAFAAQARAYFGSESPGLRAVPLLVRVRPGSAPPPSDAGTSWSAILHDPVTASELRNFLLGHTVWPGVCSPPPDTDFRELAAPIRGATILIAEDNEINRQVTRELLQQAGLKVELAKTGGEALHLVERRLFDAILMDLEMPEIGGLEATRQLRRRFPELPVIAMTAAAATGDRQRCLEAGMNDHLAKPIVAERLISVLLRWIRPRDSAPGWTATSPRERTPPLLCNLPTTLPGIDLAEAVAALGGSQRLYLHLLAQFQTQFATACETLQSQLAEDRLEAAGQLAHSLRGLAGSIGARRLWRAAEEMEGSLEKRGAEDAGDLDPSDLCDALAEVHSSIDRLARSTSAMQAYGDSTRRPAAELLAEITALVRRNELVDPGILADLSRSLADYAASDLMADLTRKLDTFDYEAALELLGEIGSRLENNQPEDANR